MKNVNAVLTVAEMKLLLRLRQLRKYTPITLKVVTFPLQVNVKGVWETLETSGSIAR